MYSSVKFRTFHPTNSKKSLVPTVLHIYYILGGVHTSSQHHLAIIAVRTASLEIFGGLQCRLASLLKHKRRLQNISLINLDQGHVETQLDQEPQAYVLKEARLTNTQYTLLHLYIVRSVT